MTAGRTLVAALAGAAFAVIAWLVRVPWDLSEVSSDGRVVEGGGDQSATPIALVGVAVGVVGLLALSRRETRGDAAALVAGGLTAWTILFAWRAGVSETVGANMFLVPLVLVFVPAAVLSPLVVHAAATRLDRR